MAVLFLFVEKLFTRTDRQFQAIFGRCALAGPPFVVGTVVVTSQGKIREQATTGKRPGLTIASGRIGLPARQGINKRQKETVLTLIDGQLSLLSIHLKTELAKAGVHLHTSC